MKNSWWAITALILFSLGSYPAYLYTTAGKNAFIVSTSFVIFVLYYVTNNPQQNWKTISFSNTLIFALIMTHYPNGFIAVIFLVSYYLFNLSQLKRALLLLPGCLLATFWGLTKYFQNRAEILNPEYISFLSDRYEVSLSYFKNILNSTWRASVTTLGTGIESKILLFLSLS